MKIRLLNKDIVPQAKFRLLGLGVSTSLYYGLIDSIIYMAPTYSAAMYIDWIHNRPRPYEDPNLISLSPSQTPSRSISVGVWEETYYGV